MVNTQKLMKDIHFMIGLVVEYYRNDEREFVQRILDNIQEIYDSEKENSIWGLREIELNLRKLTFYIINSYHTDLLEIIIEEIEKKVRKMEEKLEESEG